MYFLLSTNNDTVNQVKRNKSLTKINKFYLYILPNCQNPVIPKKMFTANKFQFFGTITIEYLAQIDPESKIYAIGWA